MDILVTWLLKWLTEVYSRVASPLNFLTGEGISCHPKGCEHSTLEALIQDDFTNGNDIKLDDSTEESDHNSEGLTIM